LDIRHRISTSEFKCIDFLEGKFVLQVACGQQHTIARVVDRNSNHFSSTDLYVGSRIGGNAFIWGNGMLGQLGLGRRGTSKGRLLPTLIPSLAEAFPNRIIDVAAGHNFTVAVTSKGQFIDHHPSPLSSSYRLTSLIAK
jgi:hypothetical protein